MTAKYELLQEIGHGSRSSVYLVRNKDTDELIAMKQYSYNGQGNCRELEILKEMKGKGIPFLIDCIRQQDKICIFMEYVSGQTLRMMIKEKHIFSEEEVLLISTKVLQILKLFHTHTPALIYGDLKPENIMLTERGEVYLVDFESVIFEGEKHNEVLGTKAYSYENSQAILPFRDTYALGLIMYEMLTGYSYQDGMLNGKADVCHLSVGCQKVIQKAVRLNPQEGYQDATQMLLEMDEWKNQLHNDKHEALYQKKNRFMGDTKRFILHGFKKNAMELFLIFLMLFLSLFIKYEIYHDYIQNVENQEMVETVIVKNKEIGNHYSLDKDKKKQEQGNHVETDEYGRMILRKTIDDD